MANKGMKGIARLIHNHVAEQEGTQLLMEARSSTLRHWYIKGQAYFRAVLDLSKLESSGSGIIDNSLDALNDSLQELEHDDHREGFLMGWQSDAWAHQHGLAFSAEGTGSWTAGDEQ